MNNQEFDACIRQILAGDRFGLKTIYENYASYIYAVVYDVVGSRENAEDLTVDFFMKLWKMAGSYKEGSGHKTWMTTIARNLAIDFTRRENLANAAGAAEMQKDATETSHPSAESVVLGKMTLQDAVALLPEAERQIVTMKIVGEMTFKEIAGVMQMPMGTVTWKYQNSIKQLKGALV